MEEDRFIYGEYVLQGIPNAFNDKISYWLSKKGMTVAYYCFSTNNPEEVKEHDILGYIHMAEERFKQSFTNTLKSEEVSQVLTSKRGIGRKAVNQAHCSACNTNIRSIGKPHDILCPKCKKKMEWQ